MTDTVDSVMAEIWAAYAAQERTCDITHLVLEELLRARACIRELEAQTAADHEVCDLAAKLVEAMHAAADAFDHGIASRHGMSLLAHSARHKALADAVAEAGVALARAVDHRAGRTS